MAKKTKKKLIRKVTKKTKPATLVLMNQDGIPMDEANKAPKETCLFEFCIATDINPLSVKYAEYVNLKCLLEVNKGKYVPNSVNRIYIINNITKSSYPDVSSINPAANNILYLTSHNLKLTKEYLLLFKYITVSSMEHKRALESTFGLDNIMALPPLSSQIPIEYRMIEVPKGKPSKASTKGKKGKPVKVKSENVYFRMKKTIDILYMGDLNKTEILEDLLPIVKSKKYNLKIYGNMFDLYNGSRVATKYWAGSLPSPGELPFIVDSSKVVIHHINKASNLVGVVNSQYLDYLRNGAFVLTKDNASIERTYKGICYQTTKELETLLDKYLSNDAEREDSARQAYEVLLSDEFNPINIVKEFTQLLIKN